MRSVYTMHSANTIFRQCWQMINKKKQTLKQKIMIKTIKMSSLLVFALLLNSCASGYKKINPRTLSYNSKNTENNVTLEYKYELLHRKYKKNETKNGIKLIAIKITNNTLESKIKFKYIKILIN